VDEELACAVKDDATGESIEPASVPAGSKKL
jgi:hypothetical protein